MLSPMKLMMLLPAATAMVMVMASMNRLRTLREETERVV